MKRRWMFQDPTSQLYNLQELHTCSWKECSSSGHSSSYNLCGWWSVVECSKTQPVNCITFKSYTHARGRSAVILDWDAQVSWRRTNVSGKYIVPAFVSAWRSGKTIIWEGQMFNYGQAEAPFPSTMASYAENNSHYSSFNISVRSAYWMMCLENYLGITTNNLRQ
jgi:hypothetical protein